MACVVLTSKNRIIGLPVSLSELAAGEQVVATNADMGMLFVKETGSKEILMDYAEIDPENLPDGAPICVPYIEEYKKYKIEELKDQIKEFEDLTDD